MEPIEEAKKTMNELCETEKFEELLKYCLELLKDVSQNLSYYDKIRILQYEELALRGLDRQVEADEVSTELMTMPKDDKEN
ncbi:MAG: hypothetical protein NPMRTHETA2_2850001 [Nitrosopumilales archaeon]|nr:MAG: hypothetical protein NPMRTHETA2_2850001 [Nitrosopumilales archaeon]